MVIKLIIFDVGNVLVGPEYASDYMAKVLKVEQKKLWQIMEPLVDDYVIGKISKKIFWRQLHKGLKIESKKDNYDKELFRLFMKEGLIRHNVINLTKQLKQKGYKLAILSNTTPDFAYVRKNLRFMKFFDGKFFSPEIKMKKPQRKAYIYVLKKMKVKPEECLFIDNLRSFIIPAKKLGMKTILFKNDFQLERELNIIGVL